MSDGTEDLVYMVVRQDTNGERYLVEGCTDLSLVKAHEKIGSILAQHTKPHKMDYFPLPYRRGEKNQALVQYEIRY